VSLRYKQILGWQIRTQFFFLSVAEPPPPAEHTDGVMQTHTKTHTRARVRVHTHTHTHTHPRAHAHTHTHACTRAHTHTHTHTPAHSCANTCTDPQIGRVNTLTHICTAVQVHQVCTPAYTPLDT